jgi:hypothetical protein
MISLPEHSLSKPCGLARSRSTKLPAPKADGSVPVDGKQLIDGDAFAPCSKPCGFCSCTAMGTLRQQIARPLTDRRAV